MAEQKQHEQQQPRAQQQVVPREFFKTLDAEFGKRRTEFANLLPKFLTPEKFYGVIYQSIARTPRLQECTIASILKCAMQAAELGLYLGGTLGQAYMVPFNNKKLGRYEAQFVAGYRGFAHLCLGAGGVAKLEARVVHARDEFRVELGTDPRLIHVPFREVCSACEGTGEIRTAKAKPQRCSSCDGYGTASAGRAILYYCVAVLSNGQAQFEYMEIEDIDAIRARSKAKDDGPWVTDYDEMAKKTVFKRLFKWLPITDGRDRERIQQAIALDNQATGLEDAIETTSRPLPSELFEEHQQKKGAKGSGDADSKASDDQADPSDEPIGPERRKVLDDTIKGSGLDEAGIAELLERFKIESLDDVNVGQMQQLLKVLLEG